MTRDWGKGERKRAKEQNARQLAPPPEAKRKGHREGGMGPTTLTYMLLRDAADVPDVHDLPLVPHHAHRDGVLAHLRGDVAVHLNSQVLQHQKPCASQRKARSLGLLPSTLVFAGGSPASRTHESVTGRSPTLPSKLQDPSGSYFMPTLIYLEGHQDQTIGGLQNQREQQVTFWVASSLLFLHPA